MVKNAIVLILLVSFSCTNCGENPVEDKKIPRSDASNNQHKSDSVENLTLTAIQSLLMEPIDLKEFKKSYGPSNSGAGCSEFPTEWRHQPEKKGFYYQYMLFHKLQEDMRYLDGKTMNEYDLFKNFRLFVYRFGDNGEFDFYDNTEVLIGLRSSGAHEALGKLNLVGKSLKELDEFFGNDYIEKKNVRIYHYNKRVLSLQITKIQDVEKVESLIYLHLSKELDKNNIPDMLLNFIL